MGDDVTGVEPLTEEEEQRVRQRVAEGKPVRHHPARLLATVDKQREEVEAQRNTNDVLRADLARAQRRVAQLERDWPPCRGLPKREGVDDG